ncbi:magnesium transporter MRS2-C-like isoform X2 [Phragmites australis]|uniref:magnesium transporter MRS2-C-like isoform X2 n=1 Tax=Phragmites australis TaxID=29695 RepID=UPI002D78C4A2|nr:magnesium transporter MRS2-C-like isoform X2 [Phragmites australis]
MDHDLRDRLLLPSSRAVAANGPHQRRVTPASVGGGAGGGGVAIDVNGLKRRGCGRRSWVRVDAATGASESVEVAKPALMRRLDLPARDLRLLDPLFVYPSAILGRERAIVCNLERIRCIITADEALVLRDPDSAGGAAAEEAVRRYVDELQRRLVYRADDLPFEFIALEVALEDACSFLDSQAVELEAEAYPLLDDLTAKISTLNLERVRRLKSKLVALTRRVQKVRDETEQLMDDDGDMAEMYLTEKKRRMEGSVLDDEDLQEIGNNRFGSSLSAPVSPVSSPPAPRRLEKELSLARSRHDSFKSFKSSDSNQYNIEELEMLLEAYFVVIDYTLSKLTSDNVRNQLIQFELLLSTATFVVAIFGVVSGVFGMNFAVPLFSVPHAFEWTLAITGVCGGVILFCFLWYFKKRRLFPL